MMYFIFTACDKLELDTLGDLESFEAHFPNIQPVFLNNENELKLLLEQMGIQEFVGIDLNNTNFSKYWDLSNFKFPELNEQQFDEFYKAWIAKSGRINDMDEYGMLIFLQVRSANWNKLRYRLIIRESE